MMTNNKYTRLVKLQKAFFNEHITREIPFRLCALDRLAEALVSREKQLGEALHADLGKSAFESYATEIGFLLHEIRTTKNHLQSWARDRRRPTPLFLFGSKSRIHYEPYGCTLIIAPWNYPLQLALSPLIGAIAAGNCAIVKPSGEAPRTAAALQELIDECFEEEYIAVTDANRETTELLLQERFDYIFYTGGVEYGRHVMQAASRHLTPVTLELGGKSPCIVDDDADLKAAARRIAWGKFLNCGQTCVAPDYIYCHREVKDELLKQIQKQIRKQFGKSPLDNKNYGKIINEKHFNRIQNLIDPAKVICGGNARPETLQIEPTVMDQVTFEDAVMQEEIFGPVMPVLTFDSIEEVIRKVNSMAHPLALYIFAQEKAICEKVTSECGFGGGCINDVIIHLATSEMPFGGFGESGMGSYHGKKGFETFSHYKSIVDKKTWIDLPMRYQPYRRIYDKLIHIFLK